MLQAAVDAQHGDGGCSGKCGGDTLQAIGGLLSKIQNGSTTYSSLTLQAKVNRTRCSVPEVNRSSRKCPARPEAGQRGSRESALRLLVLGRLLWHCGAQCSGKAPAACFAVLLQVTEDVAVLHLVSSRSYDRWQAPAFCFLWHTWPAAISHRHWSVVEHLLHHAAPQAEAHADQSHEHRRQLAVRQVALPPAQPPRQDGGAAGNHEYLPGQQRCSPSRGCFQNGRAEPVQACCAQHLQQQGAG